MTDHDACPQCHLSEFGTSEARKRLADEETYPMLRRLVQDLDRQLAAEREKNERLKQDNALRTLHLGWIGNAAGMSQDSRATWGVQELIERCRKLSAIATLATTVVKKESPEPGFVDAVIQGDAKTASDLSRPHIEAFCAAWDAMEQAVADLDAAQEPRP